MTKLPDLNWRRIATDTRRAKVFGGWIVAHTNFGIALTYVPDKRHQWRCKEEEL